MKLRWKILLRCLVVLIAGITFLILRPNPYRAAADATRRSLRGQGFKVELSELNLTLLATEWQSEPFDIAHLVRFKLMEIAHETT